MLTVSIRVTAGASAPEKLVQDLIDRLRDFGAVIIEELAGVEEHMQFKLPRELAAPVASAV